MTVSEGSYFFPETSLFECWAAKMAEELRGSAEHVARLWHALAQWGLAGWVCSNGKPVSPEVEDMIM